MAEKRGNMVGEAGRRSPSLPDDVRILDMLQRSTAAGFSWVDLEGRFLRVNSGLCRMLGYSEQELLTMTFADLTHPDDLGIGPSIFRETASGRYDTSTFEKRYFRKDGELIWVLVSPTLITDDDHHPICYATITLDITQRKRAQQALERSEERYRTYVDSAPVGVFIIDGQGRYVDVNRAACAMTGYSREELLAMSVRELAHPEKLSDLPQRMRELEEEGGFHAETLLNTKDGRDLHVVLDAVKLSDDRMMAYCKDVTERVRAEEARRATEQRLQRAQQLESLGVLAGGIAHDFNNLLVGVLANAELGQLQAPRDSPAQAALRDIVRAARRAAELCQHMLAYAGKAKVESVELDLSEATREMVELLGSTISSRATVSCKLGDDLPPILADAAQVRQVIMNLLLNAAESRPDGEVRIEVETGVAHFDRAALSATYLADDLPEGRYVYFQVRDDGLGMDEETRRRMFEPFFSTKPSGRGLGLAALVGIVRVHRGAIGVESAPREGTTLRVIIPVSTGPEPRRVDEKVTAKSWTGSGTILLVDDEELVRNATRALLETLGFDVVAVSDAAAALKEVQARVGLLACLMLDYSMPGMNGAELLQRLRGIDSRVPAIVFSGYSDQGLEGAFAGMSVSAFLNKPFSRAELADKLKRALGS